MQWGGQRYSCKNLRPSHRVPRATVVCESGSVGQCAFDLEAPQWH